MEEHNNGSSSAEQETGQILIFGRNMWCWDEILLNVFLNVFNISRAIFFKYLLLKSKLTIAQVYKTQTRIHLEVIYSTKR